MLPSYRGRAGEYLWEKEMQRLDRYKDRPWELERRQSTGVYLAVLAIIFFGTVSSLLLWSLFL